MGILIQKHARMMWVWQEYDQTPSEEAWFLGKVQQSPCTVGHWQKHAYNCREVHLTWRPSLPSSQLWQDAFQDCSHSHLFYCLPLYHWCQRIKTEEREDLGKLSSEDPKFILNSINEDITTAAALEIKFLKQQEDPPVVESTDQVAFNVLYMQLSNK